MATDPEVIYRIKNISRQRIRIYLEPDTGMTEGEWVGLNPGVGMEIERHRVNEGWIDNLADMGIIRVDRTIP